jgi:hypothetical protein
MILEAMKFLKVDLSVLWQLTIASLIAVVTFTAFASDVTAVVSRCKDRICSFSCLVAKFIFRFS